MMRGWKDGMGGDAMARDFNMVWQRPESAVN